MPREDGTPYYEVAAATYPNGLFLGGFGTPQNPIAEDFLPHERKLKPRLKHCLDACEARLKTAASEREMKRMGRLRERVKKSPTDGNIWEVTAKHGWRRRGWMDFAYPGIGEGPWSRLIGAGWDARSSAGGHWRWRISPATMVAERRICFCAGTAGTQRG
jgi:hypothetical protein